MKMEFFQWTLEENMYFQLYKTLLFWMILEKTVCRWSSWEITLLKWLGGGELWENGVLLLLWPVWTLNGPSNDLLMNWLLFGFNLYHLILTLSTKAVKKSGSVLSVLLAILLILENPVFLRISLSYLFSVLSLEFKAISAIFLKCSFFSSGSLCFSYSIASISMLSSLFPLTLN